MAERIQLGTPDGTEENAKRIAELFPEVMTEVEDAEGNLEHVVDFDALRDLLGDVAEGQRERYQFTWPGKSKARAEARKPVRKTMRPEKDKSVDWDTTRNLYIEGDNLDALKLLKETYAGQVKLIYIDPPYNTGHDFVYDDDYRQTHEEYDAESADYDEDSGRLVANPDSNGRFHSNWCSMIYPRLVLARDLLSADGAIFISIDDNESANLRKICDEIFGAGCFVGDIAWQRTYSPRNDSKGIPAEIEHILVFSKQNGWIPGRLPRTAEMDSRYSSPDGDPVPWKAADASAPGAATHQGMVYAVQHPLTGELLYPPNGRCRPFGGDGMLSLMSGWAEYEWRDIHDEKKRAEICGIGSDEVRPGVKALMLKEPSEETFAGARKRYEAGNWPRLCFTSNGTGGMIVKRYITDVEGKMPTNLWPFSEVGHTDEAKKQLQQLFDGSAPFDTPKPVRLLNRILTIASDKDSLVLDFFSGSATTAEAVMRKNSEDGGTRRFILVQLPEEVSGGWGNLCKVGEERIRRAGAKIRAEVEEANRQLKLGEEPKPVPDVGFRVLCIDSSNMEDTYRTPDETDQMDLLSLADNVKLDRTPEDLLFEVLPKFRISYSARIEKRSLGGKECFLVDGNRLVACFDTEVGTDTIEEMARLKPDYAVMRDASMRDDATQANFEELFKTYSPDTVRRVI
ncbi:MAG: site-specific DNA-methyltransferase [Atopobiaceae bacterium]|jgi:adenine-specific DNA-methyltransferase|nr:site-specific DNA-methyltransferase [Atopobiaceae bacterium]MCI2051305.1 site-specific DNA-methyltransferase [Atopobiaceae bacterium]